MEDDFTFPTVVAAAAPAAEQQGVVGVGAGAGELPCPAGHYLWPFSSSVKNAPPAKRATEVKDRAEDAPPPTGRGGRAVVVEQHDAEADGEDRMDMLWEDFNDAVALPSGSGAPWPAASADGGGCRCRSSSTTVPSDDAELEDTPGRPYGCAPTMLRASSRAGGAEQFFTGGRGRGRGRGHTTAGWTLLLRLFRRLFAVDKTLPSRSTRTATVSTHHE